MAAHERYRRSEPDQAAEGGRTARRSAGVLCDSDCREICRNSRTGSARGAASVALWVVSVPDGSRQRTDVAGGVLAHRRLSDNDGAGLFQPAHDGGVSFWNKVLEQYGSVCRWHVIGLDL